MTRDESLMSVPEVAVRLGISVEGVRRRIASGELRAVKLGPANSSLRITPADLSAYVTEHVVTHS